MYDFTIKDSRLSLLGATTGGSLHLLLAHYSIHKISDGCDNRFLYHFIENNLIPYDLIKKSDPCLPSLQQIFVIIHIIGRIIYVFKDSTGNDEAQRYYATKFCLNFVKKGTCHQLSLLMFYILFKSFQLNKPCSHIVVYFLEFLAESEYHIQ
jgi:hypothetical protein